MTRLKWDKVSKQNQMKRLGVERAPTAEEELRHEKARHYTKEKARTPKTRPAAPAAEKQPLRYISARIIGRRSGSASQQNRVQPEQ